MSNRRRLASLLFAGAIFATPTVVLGGQALASAVPHHAVPMAPPPSCGTPNTPPCEAA